jgi:carbon monoxide dehydrogenase subunit G
MPVITTDVLIEGIRRDDVFTWLSDPDNHDRFLAGAFDEVAREGDRSWALTLNIPPRSRRIGYEVLEPDDSHGGRRVLCRTTGKRTAGRLNYSLRTMKPSSNTLVTLHADYESGGLLGSALDMAIIRKSLESRYQTVLDNLAREILKDNPGS